MFLGSAHLALPQSPFPWSEKAPSRSMPTLASANATAPSAVRESQPGTHGRALLTQSARSEKHRNPPWTHRRGTTLGRSRRWQAPTPPAPWPATTQWARRRSPRSSGP